MTTILFIYFIMRAVNFILTKKLKLDEKLMDSRYMLLYKLGKCGFCFNFWIAVIVTVIYYILPEAGWLIPFGVMGVWIVFNEWCIITGSNEQ